MMETTEAPRTTENLPARLATVFRSLRAGRHICRDDVADYRDLDHNEEQYRALFEALGYELVHHGQGFYYFKGGNSLTSQRLQAITLFTLILFRELEDNKFSEPERAWERTLTVRIFEVDQLPHFETSQRRSLLHAVGVTPETLHEKVLRPMSRMGLLEMLGSERFQFRSPVYRFVDMCMQFAGEEWGTPDQADEESRDDKATTTLPAEAGGSDWQPDKESGS